MYAIFKRQLRFQNCSVIKAFKVAKNGVYKWYMSIFGHFENEEYGKLWNLNRRVLWRYLGKP